MTSSSPLSTGLNDENLLPVLSQANPKALHPHPSNSYIYGSDEDVRELVELIASSGWIKPLVVTRSFRIISGHRRWKAALQLELESVPVEVREFPNELAELEALLLENASRYKTIEQKVREASAWKEVEASKASLRQILLAGTRPNTQPDLQANLPEGDQYGDQKMGQGLYHTDQSSGFPDSPKSPAPFSKPSLGEKGQIRDIVALRVGLRARNYEKAAKVVEVIDEQTSLGNSSCAQALRRVLNEQSVDAAYQLLKKTTEERAKILETIASGQAKTTKEAFALQKQQSRECQGEHEEIPHTSGVSPSCWNCQNRGELIANHGFYCNRLGALSLLDKSADVRGAECDLWSYRWGGPLETRNSPQPTHETFTLTLPAYLQPLLQDAARTTGMSLVDWAITVLESKALALCNDKSVTQPTERPEMQVAQCRSL